MKVIVVKADGSIFFYQKVYCKINRLKNRELLNNIALTSHLLYLPYVVASDVLL